MPAFLAHTAKGSTVLYSKAWPKIDDKSVEARGEIAVAIMDAIEANQIDTVLAGIGLLLGKAGLAIQAKDSQRIADDGKIPLIVALVARVENTVPVVVTTVVMPVAAPRTLH